MNVNIPFTVGGGVRSEEDVSVLLDAGADKITINTSAVYNPGIIDTLSGKFGSQCIVLAIDANFEQDDWYVYTHGGRKKTNRQVFTWAQEAEQRGAGEILLTSMIHDGTKNGFAVNLTRRFLKILTFLLLHPEAQEQRTILLMYSSRERPMQRWLRVFFILVKYRFPI